MKMKYMNKSLLFSVIGLSLMACSNNDENKLLPPGSESSVTTGYLSIKLAMSPGLPGSKAGDPNYVDGSPTENNINAVRFFFFDSAGNPAPVWQQAASGTYASYLDWLPTDADQSYSNVEGETVEKIVNATLGINVPSQASMPEMVLAIVNPVEAIVNITDNPTLDELRLIVADYYTGLTNNNFVITNSTYADNGTLIDATPIEDSNLAQTVEDAMKNPLVIYVERALARLDLSINIPDGVELPDGSGYMYSVSDEPYQVGGQNQEIYVKFLGWNITSTPNASRLVKKISPSWNTNIFGNLVPWNSDDYHRSFWAINPEDDDFDYLYGNYNGAMDAASGNYQPAMANEVPGEGESVTAYMQENAAIYSETEDANGPAVPSKVIIAAQLLNSDAEPLTLAYWANRYYTLDGILAAAANSLNLYQAKTSDGNTIFTQIGPNDLDVVSATELYGEELPDDVAGYYVYVQLTEDASKITWYNGNTLTSPTLTTQQANNYIIDRVNYFMLWQSGQTYYYFDIKHLGALGNPGYLGVVRNHVYRANITSVAGLGTPVFKPGEIIYPETPEYDDAVISAQIQVLQWRIVSQDYELVWP